MGARVGGRGWRLCGGSIVRRKSVLVFVVFLFLSFWMWKLHGLGIVCRCGFLFVRFDGVL